MTDYLDKEMQPPATEPWEHKEIARLKAEIARLEGELAQIYEIGRSEMAVIREKVAHAFHKFGLNHTDAVAKVKDVLGPE